jgi:hypothetical protein
LNGAATAASATDYTLSDASVTFANGAAAGSTQTFTVTANTDSIAEGLEAIQVSLLDDSFATVASETTAITNVASAQSFVLTNDQNQTTGGADSFTGTTQGDTFIATADGALGNGDVIDGGDGTDTLNARYSLAADTTINASVSNVEQLNIDHDDGAAAAANTLTMSVAFDGLTEVNVENAGGSNDNAEDTIALTQAAAGVDLGIENGDGEFNVSFALATATGTSDAVTVNLDTADVDTVTIADVETVTVNTENGDSEVDTLTTAAATTLNITGTGGLTVTDVDDVTTTIDASATTGAVSVAGTGDVDLTATAGSGGLSVDMSGTTVDNDDTFTGSTGTDRLIVDADETAALTGLSSVEELEIDVADIDEANGGGGNGVGTVELSGLTSSDVNSFFIDVTSAANGDQGTVTVSALDSGDTITILDGGSDTDDAGAGEGISLATTLGTDSASDELTVNFAGIGAVSDNTSDGTGYAQVEADEIETLNIGSNADATGNTTVNGVEVLTAQAATSIILTGAADFAASSVVNTTALTSIDATAMTGDLTLDGVDESDLTLTDGSGDLSLTIAGLNNADTIDGGDDDTAGDTVTATTVSGRTATTGELNVSNVENLNIQATGANTFNLSSLSNVGVFAISGATPGGTQTLTNVAAGLVLALGEDGQVFEDGEELDVTLADATGTSDELTINVNNTATAATDATLDIADVETITLDVAAAANNATVGVANAEATTLNVVDGGAGAVLALGTLNAATSTVDLSGYDGEVTFSGANVTSGMTVTASSSADDDAFTLSGEDDTITIAETGAVDVAVDGGAGTDTMNLTVTTGFVDTGEINNFENLNLTVTAGADIFIGANNTANTDADAIAEATNVTITGGNSLSTFEVGDSDAGAADTITAAVDIDASAFAGNVFLDFADDVVTSTVDIDAGSLATDTVAAAYTDDAATDVTLQTTGVETFIAYISDNDNGVSQATFDLSDQTGLATLALAASANGDTFDVDDYVSSVTVQLGAEIDAGVQEFGNAASELDVNLASASGDTDTVNLQLRDTADGDDIDVDAAGVEVLNIALTDDAESHSLDLAGVTASTGESVTVNISGGVAADGLTISNAGSTIDTIDASASDGSLTITDRDASAMTITGGSDDDSIRMENASDVLTGGDGTDTLTIVQNAVLGGFQVDLSASGDQVTTYNGSANAAVQSGFENVDLSNITGSNGAEITANANGSTITGTSNADQINGGAGDDEIAGGAGADAIALGAGNDRVIYNADDNAGTAGTFTSAQGDDVDGFVSGTDDIVLLGDFLTGDLTGSTADGVEEINYSAGVNLNDTDGNNAVNSTLLVEAGADTATVDDLLTLADLNTAIGTLSNDDDGDEAILIFNSQDGNSAIYKYTDDDNDVALEAGELQLIGIVDSALAAGDIAFT